MLSSHTSYAMKHALVIVLCAIFFLLSMVLTIMSSNVYRHTVSDADRNDTTRTALSYLVNRIRQNDGTDTITLTQFNGAPALKLSQTIDSCEYITLLYCYDGFLREQFVQKDHLFSADAGFPILAIQTLSLSTQNNLLTIGITSPNGETTQVSLAPRCGMEVLT